MIMLRGYASAEGTARFAQRNAAAAATGFYRLAQGLTVSSVGMGTYLGEADKECDRAYIAAAITAVGGGINVLDAAINYRGQRSERSVGEALRRLGEEGIERSEILVCTKGGFLTPGAAPGERLQAEDVVRGMHSLAPAFLEDQLERSRENLGVETIDVYYLHNPETQLAERSWGELARRLEEAFALLERKVEEGKIRYYGTATWGGYRGQRGSRGSLELTEVERIARRCGGEQHHFRFIQLPVNLAMREAYTLAREELNGERVSVLECARRLGLTAVASASLLQARLARGLPEALGVMVGAAATDAQRAIQFARSAPGVSVALVGMSQVSHVVENLGVATFPPLEESVFERLCRAAGA